MFLEHFNRQKRNFFNLINFRRIDVQEIDKFPVNLNVFVLITERFQTGCLKFGFGFDI